MRGSLSPWVLAKNKRNAVFRLVSPRTDFSSEKSSCYRPTSEGICFAKQSEQWLTKPLLSQAKLARACPVSDLYCVENLFDFYSPIFFKVLVVLIQPLHQNLLVKLLFIYKAHVPRITEKLPLGIGDSIKH